MTEKDLKIYDVWESINKNIFIKITEQYSIAIGSYGNHNPNVINGDGVLTSYVKSDAISPVKKIGRIIFD